MKAKTQKRECKDSYFLLSANYFWGFFCG
jgi:hypothetical protein